MSLPNRDRPKKIITMDDLRKAKDDHQVSGDEDNEFYVGGSERSGQAVIGSGGGIYGDLLHRAENNLEASLSAHETVYLWRNGVSIGEDGELYELGHPRTTALIEALSRGETPSFMRSLYNEGEEVTICVQDRKHEAYPTNRQMKPFSGAGHLLGSPTPRISSDPRPAENLQVNADDYIRNTGVEIGTARIGIRLPDGRRFNVMMNGELHSVHTLRDLISHLVPDLLIFGLYVARGTGGLVEITDDSASLQDAQLVGNLVTVRAKNLDIV
ncbi:hypothetical protein ACOME3_003309 [Neoechinorhynchus agilis]